MPIHMEPLAEIRDARPEERDGLRELHRSSSLVWEADRANLEAHPELFGVAKDAIAEGRVRVAVGRNGKLLGFSGIARNEPGVCEIEDLFVDPEAMGRHVGTALVEDIAASATAAGDREIVVTANPDAIGFYERLGFARGEMVPTRFRPGVRMGRPVSR